MNFGGRVCEPNSILMTQTFLLAKRPSTAMNEEKRLPFAGYPCLSFYRSRTINHALDL